MAKGKNLRSGAPFVGEGEKDGAEAGLHSGDDEPSESGLAKPWSSASSPIPVSCARARSVFIH
jgi:hypothetical protein